MSADSFVHVERDGTLALLFIDHPPVNALSRAVVSRLAQALDTLWADAGWSALVLACRGRSFVAGADIGDFDAPDFSPALLNATLDRLEASARPVVAALHGHAYGAGLELALACHGRVAAAGTRLGLPEVTLGLLPGSLGTQRLPRLIGAPRALAMMLDGKPLDAAQALDCGLLDRVVDADPVAAARSFALDGLREGTLPRRSRDLRRAPDEAPPAFFADARAKALARRPALPAPGAIIDCVEAAVTLPFEQGAVVEAQAFERLRRSPASQALRHLFFAERQAAKLPALTPDVPARPLQFAGVVGGGTMGRGIALSLLGAGLDVTLVETSPEALERARQGVRELLDAAVSKGRLTATEADARFARLHPTLDDRALAQADLVIEAVFERLDLKLSVCRRLGELCRPGAIIATNTSTLDVNALARATGRPADVVGLHFFSPAHVMRLLEVVRGAHTAPEVLRSVLGLARRIGKVAVVSGVCWGFIGNRMLEPYLREADRLLLEGAEPERVDGVMEALGFAMGPCRMLDLAGVDVAANVVVEAMKSGRLPADPSYRAVVRALCDEGRLGQKTGLGHYRHEGRTARADPAVTRLCEDLARRHRITRRESIGDEEIRERLLYPLINEGARLLEEGIAARASDIDVVWTCGYGFPEHLGGPMHLAGRLGLAHIAERLIAHGRQPGRAPGDWTPAALLQRLAATGGVF